MIGFMIFVLAATLAAAVGVVVLTRIAFELAKIAFLLLKVVIEIIVSVGFGIACILQSHPGSGRPDLPPLPTRVTAEQFAEALRREEGRLR